MLNMPDILDIESESRMVLDHLPPDQAPYDWCDLHVAWSILCFSVLLESCQRLNENISWISCFFVVAPRIGLNEHTVFTYVYIYIYIFQCVYMYIYSWQVTVNWRNIELTFVVFVIWTSLEIVSDVIYILEMDDRATTTVSFKYQDDIESPLNMFVVTCFHYPGLSNPGLSRCVYYSDACYIVHTSCWLPDIADIGSSTVGKVVDSQVFVAMGRSAGWGTDRRVQGTVMRSVRNMTETELHDQWCADGNGTIDFQKFFSLMARWRIHRIPIQSWSKASRFCDAELRHVKKPIWVKLNLSNFEMCWDCFLVCSIRDLTIDVGSSLACQGGAERKSKETTVKCNATLWKG